MQKHKEEGRPCFAAYCKEKQYLPWDDLPCSEAGDDSGVVAIDFCSAFPSHELALPG